MGVEIFSSDLNVVEVRPTSNTLSVVEVSPSSNIVNIVEPGTPVLVSSHAPFFTDRDTYWSSAEIIAVGGFGEYYNSTFKPIFIFDGDEQRMSLTGSISVMASGSVDPFKIETNTSETLFKINTEEIPVFKMHTTTKTAVSGGLLFLNGELFYGA